MDGARPQRVRLPDFAGRPFTLPDNPQSWQRLNPGRNEDGGTLVLGLGPTGRPPLAGSLLWLEEPATLRELARFASFRLPKNGGPVEPDQLPLLARSRKVYFYRPAMRLAPEFWAPLLARLEAAKLPLLPKHGVWLPGDEKLLLHQELSLALRGLGFAPLCAQLEPQYFLRLLGSDPPEMVLSVNFRGLDGDGRIFGLCRELGIPVAVWLVDNPWHLLSGIPLPWWREAAIFVTDKSFARPLREYGAKHVWPLPLAVAPHMWRELRPWQAQAAPIFVGRSRFPDHEAYFGRRGPDAALLEQARQLLQRGRAELPDYHWWQRRTGVSLWPGLAGRLPGQGADACSAQNRARWLTNQTGLRIVGDEGWRGLPGKPEILPPVDYYASLPDLYAAAGAVLNVTSLLLPQSLNQRHFDVWAAGGLLLSDNTAGLDIFPEELVGPIRLESPADFGPRLAWLRAHAGFAEDLRHAWREHLCSRHLYEHRLLQILEKVGLAAPKTPI